MTADAAVRVGGVGAGGWWLRGVGRSQDLASCSQREVDTASWGFVLHAEEAEDQGLLAGTEDPIPRVEAGLGVGIDSEAVRSKLSPDEMAAVAAGAEAFGLAASVTVDQRALNRQPRQDSPQSQRYRFRKVRWRSLRVFQGPHKQ